MPSQKIAIANTEALAALKKSLSLYSRGTWHDETLYHLAMTVMIDANQKYGPHVLVKSWGGNDPPNWRNSCKQFC